MAFTISKINYVGRIGELKEKKHSNRCRERMPRAMNSFKN